MPKVVDVGKLAQMIAYDAVIEESGDMVDDAIRKAADLAKETGWYQATAELNPLVVEAQKTISYEIAEQFGGATSGLLFRWEAAAASIRFGKASKNSNS